MLVIFLLLQPYSRVLEARSNSGTTRPVQSNAMLQASHVARGASHMVSGTVIMVFTLVSKSPLLIKRPMTYRMLVVIV